jgi:hypothetical protein
VLPVGSIIDDAATLTGFMAGAIAVGGFLGHARPVLQRKGEMDIKIGTVVGGLIGLVVAVLMSAGLEMG